MFMKRYALWSPEGDGTGGAGAGGSPNGGQGNGAGDGDETIPKTQFVAALNNVTRKLESIEAENRELRAKLEAKPPADPPKRYSRAQLNAAVAAGEITQEQADAAMDRQLQEDAAITAREVALEAVGTVQRTERVDEQIARYKAVAPEILEEGSDARQKIKTEFNVLVSLGDDPKQLSTQLKAIRAVLGPVENLERSRNSRQAGDGHREIGGGAGGGNPRPGGSGKLIDQLNAEGKKHYEKGIEQGRYKSWDDVEAELKYAKPATRQRLGLAA